MAEKEILTSNLFEAGAMFKATDVVKDNNLPPGSLGFVSFVRGIDESFQNVAKICAIMIRKGKTGKPRIMNSTICTPVFYMDAKPFIKLMPEEGVRKCYIHVERHVPMNTDIMAFGPLEFLGYAVAMSKRIKHMSDQCHHKKWPEDKAHPVNALKRLPDIFNEDPEGYMEKFANEPYRCNFVEEARRMFSALVRMQLQLDLTRVDTEINAAEFLLYTNKGEFIPKDAEDKTNEYKFAEDDNMLKNTVDFYKGLRKNISTLYNKKKKSKS